MDKRIKKKMHERTEHKEKYGNPWKVPCKREQKQKWENINIKSSLEEMRAVIDKYIMQRRGRKQA